MTFTGNKTNNQSPVFPSTNSIHLYGASIYARKFWGKEAFKPFAGLQTSFLTGKNKSSNGVTISEYTQTLFGANINAGFSYALSGRVTALGSFGLLGFEQNNSKQNSSNEKHRTTSFGFDVSSLQNRFNIGFYYTLRKGKS